MDNSHPLVSVIIPTFNRKEYLAKALASVFAQTYSSFEVIVIDDASTDGTLPWLKTEYPQVSVIASAINRGASHARNQGILQAKGQYVAFLDSDDTWLPRYLEAQVALLERNSQASLSWADCLRLTKNGMIEARWRPILPQDVTFSFLILPFIETMSCVVVRRELLMKTKLLPEDIEVSHDNDLYLQLSHWGPFVNLPEILVRRNIHSHENLTEKLEIWRKNDEEVLRRYFQSKGSSQYQDSQRIVRFALSYRDQLRFSSDLKISEIWGRRVLLMLGIRKIKCVNNAQILWDDFVSILAFIKQQFLGLRRPDSEKFPTFTAKLQHFLYLNRRFVDPPIWAFLNYRS